MSSLSKLTLVVPTFGRQRYALRNLRYWSGMEVTVHVLDGSDRPIHDTELGRLAANVHYHHWAVPIAERLQRAGELLDTEYTALLGDDEFFLPGGLQACIAELERDPALVSCMGRSLSFGRVEDTVVGWPAYIQMAGYAVMDDDPVDRMIRHMNPYACSTIYSVVRTPVWRRAMQTPPWRDHAIYALEEIQFELAVSYSGKSKVIEALTWLRSSENEGIDRSGRLVRFSEWWGDPGNGDAKQEFVEAMANRLGDGGAERTDRIREGLWMACQAYTEFCERRHRRSALGSLRVLLAGAVPLAGRLRIRQGFAQLRRRKSAPAVRTLLEAADDLADTGVRVDVSQLARIGEIVRQFHAID